MEIRDYCAAQLDTLWDETRRLVNPHQVHVDLSHEPLSYEKQALRPHEFIKSDAGGLICCVLLSSQLL